MNARVARPAAVGGGPDGTAIAGSQNDEYNTMNHSTRPSPPRGFSGTRLALALACAVAFSVLAAPPALADRDDYSDRGDHGDRHDHGRRHEQWREHRHYEVYAPPPVYYRREASPGITLCIPWDER